MAKLSSVFGMKTFRQNQQKAIITTMDGRDVLVLMPTGGGKSLCYQLPAICQTGKTRGVTFVISPLLALMSDQVQSLMQKGIDVVCFSSDQSDETNTEAWRKLTGKRKPALAYVTPEKLESSDKMRDTMRRLYDNKELARFVIDEAHVISSWGRNFRTAYKHLDRLRRDYPDVPIMALTATANKKTRKDIIDRLGIGNCEVLLQSFNRPNLHYTVRHKRKGKLGIEDMATFIKSEHPNETGIIYSNSRDKCEEVAKELREKYGLRAKHFHAKMHNEDKRRVQKGWQDGEFEIIVATIAFGMGIDKRDVRFVIHYSLSKSLDAYAQETGRAGRDGQPSDCVLYYGSSDVNTLINQIRGDEDLSQEDKRLQINEVWQMAYYCLNDVDCRRAQLLAFFDQPFDPKDCDASCNNCVEPKELKQEDVTRQATNAVKLLQSMLEREAHITQALCVNTLRGSKSAEVTKKDFDKLPLHGSAADMPMNQVQRLFTLLYCLSAFDIHTVSNGNWNYEYMKVPVKSLLYCHC
ncbi:ATP-dependent DNA helicase [Gloeophyllum trabeum ATCC 11539]|uniref:ATP-dependent DNA helicase n=1 Tax=Gloeophyllum trabeum (strain ATCC 11539 / FP-39264 / Madison 617) TaxID=670483 RepID=S7RUW0_GLOTA|nr:ATP-dependent DNA helicase [Gloeophyllum trabeum ATCC 11539]EPQ58525.1 ATP-dependent DNA helicase [Gloeophyllum trabeum ATCC 11539]